MSCANGQGVESHARKHAALLAPAPPPLQLSPTPTTLSLTPSIPSTQARGRGPKPSQLSQKPTTGLLTSHVIWQWQECVRSLSCWPSFLAALLLFAYFLPPRARRIGRARKVHPRRRTPSSPDPHTRTHTPHSSTNRYERLWCSELRQTEPGLLRSSNPSGSSRRPPLKKFDSTKGYPGEGPSSSTSVTGPPDFLPAGAEEQSAKRARTTRPSS